MAVLKSIVKRVLRGARGQRSLLMRPSRSLQLPIFLKGDDFSETVNVVLDMPQKEFISETSSHNFDINFDANGKVYFKTSNLQSKFTMMPTGSIVPYPAEGFKSVQIDYDVTVSPEVQLSLYLIWFSDEKRIQSVKRDLQSAEVMDELVETKFFDVPEGATNFGIALRVSGKGRVKIGHLNINLSETLRIDVDPILTKISQDPDPFIQNAILSGMSEYPKLVDQPYRLLTKILTNGNELAVLKVTTKYVEELGDFGHRLHLNTLKQLLMMEELIAYYQSLPKDMQRQPILISRYLVALNWTSRHDELHKAMLRIMQYPRVNTTVLGNLISYAELFSDGELETLSYIIKAKNPAHIEIHKLLTFYDLLLHRGLISVSQSLSKLLETKFQSGGKIDRINYYLIISNIAFRHKNYVDQLHYMNMAFTQSQMLTVNLIDEDKPFSVDNIYCEKGDDYLEQLVSDGPLVTIIMTTWNSEDTLEYAANSVLAQTHKNIEFIIVDDASSDNTANLIKDMAAKDTRIVPILLTDNGGTYVAKNHGRAIAKGEFVTCQDSDDWAHPQKISRLVEAITHDETLIGVECGHVRIAKDAGVQRRASGAIRKDASSLMYRREAVDETLGFYDSVRAGADGEFKFRMQRYYGKDKIGYLKELLSIVDWADGTLSGQGSEYAISASGVFSASRLAYRQSFYSEHEFGLFETGKSSLYRPQDNRSS